MNPGWWALGLAVLSFVFAEVRVRSRQKTRKDIGPAPDQLRQRLTELRSLFNEVVAAGGADNDWFLQADRKRAGQAVRDEAARAGDTKLTAAAMAASCSWDLALAAAPPDTMPLVTWAGDNTPPSKDQRLSKVADEAEAGAGHCQAAIERLNQLEGNSGD